MLKNPRRKDECEDLLRQTLPSAFALSGTIDSFNPNKIIALAHGAIGYAATAEYFGRKVDFVEAHRANTSTELRKNYYKEHISEPINSTDKILVLEDTTDNGGRTTYGFVVQQLMQRHDVKRPNIALFFGSAGTDFHRVNNVFANQLLKPQVVEESKKVFPKFLKQQPYFLDLHISSGINHDLYLSNWRLLNELETMGDVKEAFDKFSQRLFK